MGWLRRIFGSKDEEVKLKDTILFSELPAWIDKMSEESFKKVKPDIEECFGNIMTEKQRLIRILEDLKTAELHNPDIPEREKQIMEGNRTSYIHNYRQFLNFIEVSESVTLKEALNFCKNFTELLEKLAKSTTRNHIVMKQFFGDHVGRVSKGVLEMKEQVEYANSVLHDEGIEGIDEVKAAARQLKDAKKQEDDLKYEIDMLGKKLEGERFLKEKIEKGIERLQNDEKYSSLIKLEREKNDMMTRIKDAESDITALFSPIERPLRKFERLCPDQKILKNYLDSPISAVLEDDKLLILPMIMEAKKALDSGQLELKDKELEKAQMRFDEFTFERLSRAKSALLDLKAEYKKLEDGARNNTALHDLEDQKYKLEHAESQIRILQGKLEDRKRVVERLDLDGLKDNLKSKINDAFGIEVDVRWEASQTA